MNKQFKELALKAGCRSRIFTTGVGMYKNVDEDLQKFAELILNECIKTVDSTPVGYKDYRNQIEEAMRDACVAALKERFGL